MKDEKNLVIFISESTADGTDAGPADSRRRQNLPGKSMVISMIYIVTAMYAEAHPIITRFRLKKEMIRSPFQVFSDREAGVCLLISGTGMTAAAVAVSSVCTRYGAGAAEEEDFLLNIGVCGWLSHSGARPWRDSSQTGQLFLCNKILEQTTGRTFYPDILYRHPFREAPIVTGARVYEKTDQRDTQETDALLYDMEASSVYQAGACFLGPHQMSFLKTVSDDGDVRNVTPERIEQLIGENMDPLTDYIEALQAISREESRDPVSERAVQKAWEKLCPDLHCSRTMSESIRQHLRYCVLAGVDFAPVLEEMYRKGTLPCRNKREGKQRFEELKKRLL